MNTTWKSCALILSLALVVVGLAGCKHPEAESIPQATGTVSGTVLFRPGYNSIPPGDFVPTARPQAGIKVYLLRRSENVPPKVGREDILAEVETDSLGFYSINFLTGEYYLAVYEPSTGMVLTGIANGTTVEDLEISRMVPVILKPNQTLMQDFELHGIVTM